MEPKPLPIRTCILFILFFGIIAYSNTFHSPFYFDDSRCIVENYSLRPPINLVKIWQIYPLRFIANVSFALQYAFTGLAPWGFHGVNLLIHLLASMVVFAIARMLLCTPALYQTIPASQHNVFALAPALLFLTHPVQTEAVTYIVQRMTSLATLLYLATLWMYLRARLEDVRHYRLVFIFMLAAMLTKEISFTLPFAILLVELCFFPNLKKEPLGQKLCRWIPWGAFLGVIPFLCLTNPNHYMRMAKSVGFLPTAADQISRWDYLLTQFRVIRTYLRLLFFPINQCLDYDYPLSSGWGDLDTWSAFFLLLGIFMLGIALFQKYRLLAFGIFWFFLTLSVESSLIPILDVIFEHRLYLPMLGFSLFLSFLLWQWARSPSRYLTITLLITIILSGMTYARNEVWKSPFALGEDTIKKSPHKGRSYARLGDAYKEFKDDKTALWYYHKTVETGDYTLSVLSNMSAAYFRLGNPQKGIYYHQLAFSSAKAAEPYSQDILYYNQAVLLRNEKKIPEAITALKKAIEMNPQKPFYYVKLGVLYRDAGQKDAAIHSFRKAIEVAPLYKEGYETLALFYRENGEEQKALAVLMEYLQLKKKQGPLLGD